MNYTLITSRGRIMSFYVGAVAELYQTIYGGTLVQPNICNESPEEIVAAKIQQNIEEVVAL